MATDLCSHAPGKREGGLELVESEREEEPES